MRADRSALKKMYRHGIRFAIIAAGVVAIVGSGGGWISLGDWGDSPIYQRYVWVDVEPPRATAQIGQDVVFKAIEGGTLWALSFAWCRLPAGGSSCEPIADAVGPTLTVARVNLTDDQSTYRVRVTNGSSTHTAKALLMVSASSPAIFSDGDFVPAGWTSSGFSTGSPTSAFTVAQSPDGGNPGAFLKVTFGPLDTEASMRIAHAAQAAVYDPAQLGAIYSIDFRAECKYIEGSVYLAPMLWQGARSYFGSLEQNCRSAAWEFDTGRGSLVASDFTILDGPICGAAESCPDFSAAGTPITFGLETRNRYIDARATPAVGVDNWQVSIWRR